MIDNHAHAGEQRGAERAQFRHDMGIKTNATR